MARRGEGQFVALELNLVRDPKLGGLSRALRVSKVAAIGHLALWREFVLTKGTADGVVEGFSKEEIAEFLDWRGRADRMIAALQQEGFLSSRRGTYAYPRWEETVTGDYARRRARERDRGEERRAEARALRNAEMRARMNHGSSADEPRTNHGASADGPRTFGDQVSKGPPGGGPEGGGGGENGPSALWDWFRRLYPKVRDPLRCQELLAELPPEEVAHLRYALPKQAPIYIGRKERFRPPATKYLEERHWHEVKLDEAPSEEELERRRKERAEKAERERREREAEEDAREKTRLWLERRADLKARLKAEGLRGDELDARLDQEMGTGGPN